jgi:two-component sensor histidine kinase/HAMP domain-containing protein
MAWSGLLLPFRLADRLALRLAALLSVALLPLGILAIVTSLESRRSDIRSTERTLVSLTADTEAARRALIESALTTARTLAPPTIERLDDPEACRALMTDTMQRAVAFSFIGFTEVDGWMRCASAGEPQDFSDSATFRATMADPRAVVRHADTGVVTGRPVLIASQPVFEDGTLRGFLSVAIDQRSVAWLFPPGDADAEVRTVLFNRLGDVLTSGNSESDPGDLLPEGVALADLAGADRTVFEGRTATGEAAVFAVAELVPGQVYVLGVWDPGARAVAGLGGGGLPLLLPMLMWLASIGVVYFALHFLVIRHLRHLGRQMRRFALGDRTPQEPLPENASYELREVQATFNKMAALVARDEVALSKALEDKEAALAEKTILLKEVHHRVKNNLQLIASILNLQMRRLQDPRTLRVLQNVQDRVISLAAIHRSLYQSDQLSALRADLLIDELLRHLFAVGTEGGSGIDLRTELEPVTLDADQLVPLSLLLTEAVTNALKHVGTPSGADRPWIRVGLKATDQEIVLSLTNSVGPRSLHAPEEPDAPGSRLGTELIDTFASQLGARLDSGERQDPPGRRWEVRVHFARADSDVTAGTLATASTG